MSQSFDLLLRGGTVVNHDGEGLADIGVTAGASPPSATCRRRRPAAPSIAAASTSCPA